jgi:putative tricarboxylic transport membrane protein
MRYTKKAIRATSVAAAALLVLTGCAAASETEETEAVTAETVVEESFELDGPITMIVPFGAGGGSDISGRAIAAGVEGVTGENVSVENRTGGGGAVGYSFLLGAQGRNNFLLASETAMLALPATGQVQFTWQDFTPIMKLGDDFTMLIARPDSPFETCKDVADAAKTERVVAATSGGATGLDSIVLTLIEQDQGVEFDKVPVESGDEALAVLLSGTVDITANNAGEILGQLEAGTVKALCVLGSARYTTPLLADIATATEQGVNVSFAQFRGWIAAPGISQDAIDYWIEVGKAYAETPEYTAYLDSNVMQANVLYGDDFRDYLEKQEADLAAVIAAAIE